MHSHKVHIAPLIVLAALALALTACGRQTPLAPTVASNATHVSVAARSAAVVTGQPVHFEGQTGPGSTYTIDVPADWNQELVVYAHGITLPPELPVVPPNIAGLRDLLLGQGFAVAASSFDENGYALKDGAQRTHQLTGLFTARFGPPQRVYLLGKSLGGIIALDLAETFPGEYAGCLTVSGVLGGTRMELDYIGTLRVLFDFFYPGVLPGSLYQVPPITDPQNQIVIPIATAIQTHPDRAGAIAALMGGRLPFATPTEFVTSFVNALGFQLLGANDLFDRTHDHSFFDNASVQYAGPVPPLTNELLAAVNAGVTRYSPTPDAVNYLTHYYEPTGDLRLPMLTLHNARDPQVPLFHEGRYHDLAVAAGHGDLLVQRTAPTYGHVNFTDQEVAGAFHDLVNWVENGVKPTP